ncbi:MAG: hypothetical protein JSW27_18270 [Phycisphaerales bacterium]|nr:MAG: hypothetical protein JSW27_18270 [Phycisphaerales bacterium]
MPKSPGNRHEDPTSKSQQREDEGSDVTVIKRSTSAVVQDFRLSSVGVWAKIGLGLMGLSLGGAFIFLCLPLWLVGVVTAIVTTIL